VPRRSRSSKVSRRLFIDPSGQTEIFEKSVEQEILEKRPVECLGQVFPNDGARREHFLQLLREKLKDPEFRKIEGFPIGEDEDILRMSDPPYYTACPNPFLEDFVRCYGRPYDPAEPYHREPFAVDVSVGKTDQLYKAHGYHTKVPHLAIVPSILHYTRPDDVILDGFCGSGMTGVAAQWCGVAKLDYRRELESQWKSEGRSKPEWGARQVILNDLGPAASFIAAGYSLPFDVAAFQTEARRILNEVDAELGWMYETNHKGGKKGRINFTVWSEVFSCPECTGEVVFVREALDDKSKSVAATFPCPKCRTQLTKRTLEKRFAAEIDPVTGKAVRKPLRLPVLVNYTFNGRKFERPPDENDLAVLSRIAALPLPKGFPTDRMMHAPVDQAAWGDEWRAGVAAFTHVHHLFLPRATQSLAALWRKAAECPRGLRTSLLFFVEQAIWGLSLLVRYAPTHFSQVNRYLNGRLRMFSQHSECSPWYLLDGKLKRLVPAFNSFQGRTASSWLSTGDCGTLRVPDASVDYIFTDPPFGDNFAYAELNFLVESFHRVFTAKKPEAIVSEYQKKDRAAYQTLMRACFAEYYRVLKPGRWMTVVFSNSSNAIWRAIQEALGSAGFVAADVRTLDKQQHTFNQVHGVSVKQDLVVSAYRPTEAIESRFKLGASSAVGAWAFVAGHLENLPVFVGGKGKAEVVVERTAQMLHDRMIGYHVQRGLAVPMGTAEFLAGLKERFPDRDGMYFLPQQVAEYDRKRMSAGALKQLELSVNDERSAITWLRNELSEKPRSFQDLQPAFMKELQAWARHERTVELKEILAQNFLCYEGKGPVPSQIHSYLSSNFKECRKLDKNDAALKERASDRWYVPDPAKLGDLEKLRDRALLKEFEAYRTSKDRKLKVFRTEAIRAGFKAAWNAKEYQVIVDVAGKLPEAVIQEDEYLLQYSDNAKTRLGD
jgi:DNA modification methylase/predicted RNA-binding Zn-ribbon protein involved in translation (DUF1610 family)